MKFKKNVISNIILHIVTIGIGFVTSILIARGLGTEKQGQFSYYALIFGIIASYGNIGIMSAMSYFLKRTNFKTNDIINTNISTLLIFSLVYVLAFVMFKNLIFTDSIYILLLLWSIYAITLMFSNFITTIYIANENIYVYNRYYIFLYILKGIIIIILYYTNNLNIITISLLYAIIECIRLVLLVNKIKLKFKFKIDSKILKEEFKYGIPLYLAGLFIYLNYRVDQISVRQILGNTQLGVYSIAVQLADLAFIFPESIKSAFEGRLYACKEKQEKQEISAQIIRFAFYTTVIICIIGGLCKPLVTILYGVEYKATGVAMLILLIGIPFCSIGKIAPTYFTTEGKTKTHLKVSLIVLIINIVLNYILIPKIGINGAAIASTIAYIFFGIIYIILLKQQGIEIKKIFLIEKKDVNMLKKYILNKTFLSKIGTKEEGGNIDAK